MANLSRYMATNLKRSYSLEEGELNGEIDVNEEAVLPVDALQETAEGQAVEHDVAEAVDLQEGIEEYIGLINTARHRGGLRPEEGVAIATGLRMIQKRAGISGGISVEDFGDGSLTRSRATQISLEEAKEASKGVWQRIKDALAWVWKKLVAAGAKIMEGLRSIGEGYNWLIGKTTELRGKIASKITFNSTLFTAEALNDIAKGGSKTASATQASMEAAEKLVSASESAAKVLAEQQGAAKSGNLDEEKIKTQTEKLTEKAEETKASIRKAAGWATGKVSSLMPERNSNESFNYRYSLEADGSVKSVEVTNDVKGEDVAKGTSLWKTIKDKLQKMNAYINSNPILSNIKKIGVSLGQLGAMAGGSVLMVLVQAIVSSLNIIKSVCGVLFGIVSGVFGLFRKAYNWIKSVYSKDEDKK